MHTQTILCIHIHRMYSRNAEELNANLYLKVIGHNKVMKRLVFLLERAALVMHRFPLLPHYCPLLDTDASCSFLLLSRTEALTL